MLQMIIVLYCGRKFITLCQFTYEKVDDRSSVLTITINVCARIHVFDSFFYRSSSGPNEATLFCRVLF